VKPLPSGADTSFAPILTLSKLRPTGYSPAKQNLYRVIWLPLGFRVCPGNEPQRCPWFFVEVLNAIGVLGQLLQEGVEPWRIEQHCGLIEASARAWEM
jgi:hypothetical protein